ncbi:hypothetical protein J4465_02965 [Candidatus Pacearchaeota archaeon]|nr:hypothetical protein [Candidatus Pacearchaeota archaeon]
MDEKSNNLDKPKTNGFLKYLPYFAFFCLLLIIILSIYVRTPNIDNLKDITTGNYTLGPDLDPFLYLRNAQEIVATGTVANPDMMWAAPLGSPSYAQQNLMPWAIVGLYKFLNVFSPGISLEYVAIILPVILFAITLLLFFLFIQKVFSFITKKEYSYIIAIIATLLYAVIPEMLHRTTAGIPEIESLGMIFFWLAFYFFISAWQSEKIKKSLVFSAMAGISTALMIFSWGGFRYIFMAFSLATLLSFLFQKLSKKNVLVFGIWWLFSIIGFLLNGFGFSGILSSMTDGLFSSIVLLIVFTDLVLYDIFLKNKKEKIKLPRKIFSLIISIGIMLLGAIIFFGPQFIFDKISSVFSYLLHPFGEGRVGLTVAENRAPYFTEVFSAFSTNFFGVTLSLFWLFFFGTILMFYSAIKHFDKKNKWILTSSFVLFLMMFIFSRYSPQSILNGENFLSQSIYFGGLLILLIGLIYVFIKEKKNLGETFYKINFSYLLILSLIFFSIISMRGAVRLFFIISPPIILASAFLPVKLFQMGYKSSDSLKKYCYWTLVLLFAIMLTALAVNYTMASYTETKYTVPGPYQQQWQYAMEWVRESTPEKSIFAHWWDYGYWIQTIGQRPTVTDGGHIVEFWDHTTARYLMTAESEQTTLQLCKAHNISYILFDSTDIGKYGAYASIGSDKTKTDRASWIPTYILDEKQTQELKNETIYVYTGGFLLDQDIIWKDQLLPQGRAGVAGFFVHNQNNQIKSLEAIVIYNNQRYDVPINYIYINNRKIKISETGIDGIFYFVPRLTDAGLNNVGSAFFISEKVANGEFARVYLLGETNLTLAHQEDAQIIKQIKQFYNITDIDFVLANDLYGPIKIFKVPNLGDIHYYPEYLEKKSIGVDDPASLDYLGK